MVAELASFAQDGAASAVSAPFSSVEIHEDAASIETAWADLETAAPCSIYQTRRFLEPWARTLGIRHGLAPRYVLARDDDGRPVALLPLGLKRCGPVVIARLLGGRDANLQMALVRPCAGWTPGTMRDLLRRTARRTGVDLFAFANQPRCYEGQANPLAALPHVDGASDAFGTDLPSAAETLFAAKLSNDARKKLRKKAAKLARLGPVTYRIGRGATDIRVILDAMLAQKAARFRERGIASDIDHPAFRGFMEAAAAGASPGVELHALLVGERIVATYGGAAHRGRWSGMVNSFDAANDEVGRCSPGDLLLLRIVEDCCARGLRSFDLGVGEARYKAALCDQTIPLVDAAIGFGPLGRAAAALVLTRQALKARIKRDPKLLAATRRWVKRGRS